MHSIIIENSIKSLCRAQSDKYFPFGAFGSDLEDRNQLLPVAIERANSFVGQNKFSALNTVIVGDSPRDIECAKTNKVPIVCVSTGGFEKDELALLEPEVLLDDFSDFNYTVTSIKKVLLLL